MTPASPAPSETPATPPKLRCLNCGFVVEHSYCSRCGQEDTPSRLGFGALLREAWEEFVKVDAKLLRTVFFLLFRPGFLTREYVAGKRTTYLSPFKMYLVISAVFFLFLSRIDNGELHKSYADGYGDGVAAAEKAQAEKAQAEKEQDAKQTPTKNAAPSSPSRPKQMSPPSSLPAPKQASETRPIVDYEADETTLGEEKIRADTLPKTVEEYRKRQEALPPKQRHSPAKRFVSERMIRLNRPGMRNDVAGQFFQLLPNMMFGLLPVFAFLLKLFYWRTGRFYIEHLVFALHYHSVVFLLLLVDIWLPAGWINNALGLALPVYSVLALRGMYEQGWGKTLLKAVLLALLYFLTLIFALVALALVTVALI